MQTNTKTKTADNTLTLKVSGSKIEILKFLAKTGKDYIVARTSQFLPNNEDDGEHIYVTLIPQSSAPIADPEKLKISVEAEP
jgi:hypothetical protein